MNIDEIKALIQLFETSSLSELSVKREGTQVVLKRDQVSGQIVMSPTPAPMSAPTTSPAQETVTSETSAPTPSPTPASTPSGHMLTSPLVGTFYRRPSPEEPAYVDVGSEIKAGQTLCIVEAMKVMNEIKADVSGTVREILADDGNIVEYGQPLIAIDPS